MRGRFALQMQHYEATERLNRRIHELTSNDDTLDLLHNDTVTR